MDRPMDCRTKELSGVLSKRSAVSFGWLAREDWRDSEMVVLSDSRWKEVFNWRARHLEMMVPYGSEAAED